MYESFFGLENPPFKITPDMRAFFGGGKREELLSALLYTISRGEGIVKVTGEVGSGKTTLLRALAAKLEQSGIRLVYINSPNMPALDILLFICRELGLEPDGSEPKFVHVERLQAHLLDAHSRAERVVVLIDEAQAMPPETLEEVRLLSNLETDDDKLLQMVLFGQPELNDKLDRAELRQIKDRIAFELEVEPFSRTELKDYLNFRMRRAGYNGEDLFTDPVARQIHRHTRGFPRRVNLLADKVLLAAFTAGERKLRPQLIRNALGDSGNKVSVSMPIIAAVVMVALLAALVGGWLGTRGFPLQTDAAMVKNVPEKVSDAKPAQMPPQPPQLVATATADEPELVQPPEKLGLPPGAVKPMADTGGRASMRRWSAEQLAAGNNYTLQLLTAAPEEIARFIRTLPDAGTDAVARYYRVQGEGAETAVLVLGAYPSVKDARRALAQLPKPFVKYGAFVRNIADINSDLKEAGVYVATE
ncbi:AAA family ATPase [Marinobacterium arenosum]|uniref:AAA family ATPase n=1 Tax=Marinobacterium arenosum TaxID=2862496 RepID=UPI001C93831E|nr:AAA family ATPase [Marinobacterium arenosum]MBY4676533.1 AAA family ATPase [Marinobacterium arenosum]